MVAGNFATIRLLTCAYITLGFTGSHLATKETLKGICYAIFVYFQKLNGVFASVEFQN